MKKIKFLALLFFIYSFNELYAGSTVEHSDETFSDYSPFSVKPTNIFTYPGEIGNDEILRAKPEPPPGPGVSEFPVDDGLAVFISLIILYDLYIFKQRKNHYKN